MDGCMANVIKYLLFATNFLVFLMGCVVLGFGIYALVDGEYLSDLISYGTEELGESISVTIYSTSAIILIAVSVFVVIVTFFGCCGAIKENKCMLGTYFTVILITFIVMIVGAVIGYNESLDDIKKPLQKSMARYDAYGNNTGNASAEAITKAWDQIQYDYDCCGVDSYADWDNNGSYPIVVGDKEFFVPESCCKDHAGINATSVELCRTNPGKFTDELKGCFDKFEESIEANSKNILIVGVTIVVVMFLNMLFAFALCTMTH